MSNPKILCLPPIANTLRDLHMRFTWVNKPHTEAGTPKAKEPVTFISNVHVVDDGNKDRNRHFAW